MSGLWVGVRASLFASGFIWFWAWVALSVEPLDARTGMRLPAWTSVAGLPLMAAGAALALRCIALFAAEGRGTPAPFDAPRRFVAVGPYRRVRNPMYLGALAVIVGWGLHRGSPAVLLLAAAWLALVHLLVVGHEEPALRAQFGPPYERYLKSVPRWLPVP